LLGFENSIGDINAGLRCFPAPRAKLGTLLLAVTRAFLLDRGMPLTKKRRAANNSTATLELALDYGPTRRAANRLSLPAELESFRDFGQPTRKLITRSTRPNGSTAEVPTFVNEFWTAKQRQASSLHEVSYRACFKPQLPRFFIERLTHPGEIVYDPFMGRGTTPIEAALLDRIPFGNDANPLSIVMTRPRLRPPLLAEIEKRLAAIPLDTPADMPEDLLAFYHPQTLRAISSLKRYLLEKQAKGK
jgi:hypothetical protein